MSDDEKKNQKSKICFLAISSNFLLAIFLGDFPLLQRMRVGNQTNRLDLSFAAQFES